MCVCVCVSSYLHCEWATEQQLEKDKRIQQKIKRFKMKQAQRALFFADVRMCDWFVSGDVLYYLCRHKYLVIIYLFLFIFGGGGSFCRGHFYKWVCVSPQFGVSFRMQLHVQYTSACIYLSLFTHSFDTI